MRKAQKKQIEELVMLMAEAQEEIKNAIRKKNISLALDLLEQCQQAAIQVGTSIDALEGEGHPVVTLLEQYCELVYKLHEELASGALKAGNDAATYAEHVLSASWAQINKSVEEDIPARLEVVFCPYKASMWDSLESVWKAADEDPNCTAYVIPIPYFDKMPNGAFAEEHYEGLEYPEYVPITYYKSYNFEERRPDIVFIHNPYDENNFVTTVHPFYYAGNLVKYTDKLVYIPYFVLGEPDWETMSDEGKEKMRMFCVQPGVLQSHNTIVQSEAMKKVYVETLCEEFGEQYRPMWEDKILPLGSPKFDKINSMTADDFTIPEEWKPVLYDEDGCMKKVILYNNSVSALLEHEDKMIAKMRRVFETFYENRDEVALLWRPHPLIKATIESMRPKLWEEYEKLVNEYKSASWGIYDDTTDLNRAIELADAYYGDPSSLVQLCQEKGIKIIRIQDVEEDEENTLQEIKNKNLLLYPEMSFSVRKGEYLYYFAWNCNAFMRIELGTGNVEYLGSLPGEQDNIHMIRAVDYYGKYIVFRSGNLKKDYWYDTERKCFIDLSKQQLSIQQPEKKELVSIHANESKEVTLYTKVKDEFWRFPGSFEDDIVCFDAKEIYLRRERHVLMEYAKLTSGEVSQFATSNIYTYRDKLYLALAETNHIMEFCPKSWSAEFYEVTEIQTGTRQLCGITNKLFLLTHDKRILQWNIDTKKIESVWNIDWDNEKEYTRLQSCTCWNNEVYFWGIGITNGILCSFGVKLNVITKEIKSFSYKEEFGFPVFDKENVSYSSMDEEGNVYFVSNYHRIFVYNMQTKKHNIIKMKYRKNEKLRSIKQSWEKQERINGQLCYKGVLNER